METLGQQYQSLDGKRTAAGWSNLLAAGAAAALAIVTVSGLDIALTMLAAEAAAPPGTLGIEGWFARLRADWFDALRNLGILNVVNAILSIPLFLALAIASWARGRTLAALAVALLLVSSAVYAANNNALPLLSLSQHYFAASSEAASAPMLVAGQAMLYLGEDLTAGTFLGFLMTDIAGLLMALAVLRGMRLGWFVPAVGALGYGILAVFSILVAFVPAADAFVPAADAWVPVGAAGGLLLVVWHIGAAVRLLRIRRG